MDIIRDDVEIIQKVKEIWDFIHSRPVVAGLISGGIIAAILLFPAVIVGFSVYGIYKLIDKRREIKASNTEGLSGPSSTMTIQSALPVVQKPQETGISIVPAVKQETSVISMGIAIMFDSLSTFFKSSCSSMFGLTTSVNPKVSKEEQLPRNPSVR